MSQDAMPVRLFVQMSHRINLHLAPELNTESTIDLAEDEFDFSFVQVDVLL